jgi:F0F1-type ATP synthase membrane subunit b/b'
MTMEAAGVGVVSLIFTGIMVVIAVISLKSRGPQDTLTFLNVRVAEITKERDEARREIEHLRETLAELRSENMELMRRVFQMRNGVPGHTQ